MEPVFFPLTYMSDTDISVMRECFQRFVACQPSGLSVPGAMAVLAREGFLDIRVPASIDEKRFKAVLKECRAWTDLHQAGELSYLKALGDTVPFFGETNPSKIRSDIRQGDRRGSAGGKTESLFQAAVFLQIAQELDRENADIGRDLDRVRRKERNLFENLLAKDVNDEIQASKEGMPSGTEDPGAYMTAERLAAWSRLMSGELASLGLFVTTSRAVFDVILEMVEDKARILSLNVAAGSNAMGPAGENGRHALREALEKVVSGKGMADLSDIKVNFAATQQDYGLPLSICLITGESPPQFFTRFIPRGQESENDKPLPGKYQNTLVVHLGSDSPQGILSHAEPSRRG